MRLGTRLAVRCGYYTEPTFLIIGAQKCGTSWLHRLLDAHPQTCSASRKELHFFDQDKAYRHGRSAYRQNFALPHSARGRVGFEATPGYLYYPWVAERLHAFKPELQLIAIVRDPVERAYSAWKMYDHMTTNHLAAIRKRALRDYDAPFARWIETIASGSEVGFERVISTELDLIADGSTELEPSLVRRGLYADQLERYYQVFDTKQIKVLEYREMTSDPVTSLAVVTEFLGLDQVDWTSIDQSPVNSRRYNRSGDAAARGRLRDFYRPHNDRLAELLGRELSW